MGEGASELGNEGSFMVLDRLQPFPDQRTREYQSQAASLMSLPKPLDTEMGRSRDPERARDLPRSHSSVKAAELGLEPEPQPVSQSLFTALTRLEV